MLVCSILRMATASAFVLLNKPATYPHQLPHQWRIPLPTFIIFHRHGVSSLRLSKPLHHKLRTKRKLRFKFCPDKDKHTC